MKTQLLEDIGENASLSLAPAETGGHPKADKAVQAPISTAQQPQGAPAPLELHSVFEEIAALEAQLVPAGQQHEAEIAPEPLPKPAIPATGPLHKLAIFPAARLLRPAAPAAEPLHQAAVPPPVAPTLVPDAMESTTVPRDPLFDFTPPSPATQAADPFTRPPGGLTRSRQRYLLWGACALSGALLIMGGRWLYQERNDAGALALIADEAKAGPQAAKAVQRGAIAANESTQGPEVRRAPAVPPLVMLEPDPPTAATPEQESPLPKPSSRRPPAQSDAATEPARERSEREPIRQPVRASALTAERPSGRDTTMTATLKACREHGYGAAQCVKRACSVTRYGFACRGR